jgi:hypothetical protein
MTRRELIKSLSLLSVGLSISNPITNTFIKKNGLKVIGIGNMGHMTADFFQEQHVSTGCFNLDDSFCKDNIASMFDKNDSCILAIQVENETVSATGLAIADHVNKCNLGLTVILYLPFFYEGSFKQKLSDVFSHRIPEMNHLIAVDMNDQRKKYGHYLVKEAYEAILNDVLYIYLSNPDLI